MPLFGIWAIAQVIWLGAARAHAPEEAREILWTCLVLNATAFAALAAPGRDVLKRNTLIAGIWAILIGNALVQPSPERVPALAGPDVESSWMPALRRLVNGYAGSPAHAGGPLNEAFPPGESITADFQELRATGLSDTELRSLQTVLNEPNLRAILPNSVRPPLPLKREGIATPGFWEDAAPDPPGRDGLPFYGNSSSQVSKQASRAATVDAEKNGNALFVSAPLSTTASLVQIRIVGELRPPGTSIVLRSHDGKDIAPEEAVVSAMGRWHRINFRPPPGPFRVVVRAADPSLGIGFTAPQEVGGLSWLAGKLARASFGSMIAAVSLVCFGAALRAAANSSFPEALSRNRAKRTPHRRRPR
jgi:hypothetical protein